MIDEGPVLVVAAHPDDEVLGCGGTIARLAATRAVHLLFVSDGERECVADADAVARRHAAAEAAASALGARPPRFIDLPDNRLDTLPLIDVVQVIEEAIDAVEPATVFTHFGGDLNVDHQIVHRAVMTACRPLPGATVGSIFAMEVLSSTEWAPDKPFVPTVFVDIAGQLDVKLAALRAYDAEMRPAPHARSYEAVEALARYRGASAGVAAAEAFVLLRRVVS